MTLEAIVGLAAFIGFQLWNLVLAHRNSRQLGDVKDTASVIHVDVNSQRAALETKVAALESKLLQAIATINELSEDLAYRKGKDEQ